jgi:ribosome maturation factor RimP
MGLAEDVEALARPLLTQAGMELVQVESRREGSGWVLRFILDKPEGFSLNDCGDWSHRLGAILDESGLMTHGYSLEVSSPGLNRPLRKPEDFQRFMGLDAMIKLFAPQNNQKNFRGKMSSLEGSDLLLIDRTSGFVRIPLGQIANATLDRV